MSKGNRTRRREAGLLPMPEKCIGHLKNGNRCKRSPIKGATVCRVHGGAAPQVRAKAQQRLMEGVLPLLAKLYQLATDEKVPPAVRLAAIKDFLDRAGLNSKTTLEVEVHEPWRELLISGIVASLPEDAPGVRTFFTPGDPDPSSSHPTVVEGVDYVISDRDHGPDEHTSSPAERVDYGPGPVHDPAYPPEPRAGKPTPRQGKRRRAR